jgi:hypothetical protein
VADAITRWVKTEVTAPQQQPPVHLWVADITGTVDAKDFGCRGPIDLTRLGLGLFQELFSKRI